MDWPAQHLDDPDVCLVDVRPEEAYRKGHIPGAVHLGWKALKDADNEVYVIPPDKLAPLMSALGIGNDTTVLGYDDQGGLGPARLWWVLDYYGHTEGKVLNGGSNKWVTERRALADRCGSLDCPWLFDGLEYLGDPADPCLALGAPLRVGQPAYPGS
jgi:thiosulfate/3-mercaptopyruvate sulfurtransferase